MSIFIIKIIACTTMILDHIKYAIPITNNFITTYLGRISFPLFAFLISEGYIHTSNLKKYYIRLFIFAILSQVPFMLFRTLVGEYKMLNIIFTLILGLLSITIYDKINKKYISIPIVGVIIYLGSLLKVDYSWYGVATVFVMYLCRNNKIFLSITFAFLIYIYYMSRNIYENITLQSILFYIFTFIPIVFIILYNGKKGRTLKYFFYYFYPVHMMVLYLMSFLFIK